jgi:hypothetical protein
MLVNLVLLHIKRLRLFFLLLSKRNEEEIKIDDFKHKRFLAEINKYHIYFC